MRSMHSWRSTAGASAGTRAGFRKATVMKIPAAQRLESDFTPKGFHSAAQGRESAPWEQAVTRGFYPEGVAQGPPRGRLSNPFGVEISGPLVAPGCAFATLGCGVKPLRGNLCQRRGDRH